MPAFLKKSEQSEYSPDLRSLCQTGGQCSRNSGIYDCGRTVRRDYLVKTIAVNKIIVRLDPSRQETLGRLSDLYFQRGVAADPLVESYRETFEKTTRRWGRDRRKE